MRSTGLSRSQLEVIRTHWPGLDDLRLWLGAHDSGGDVTLGDLGWIFNGRFTRLGLVNSELTDDLCAALVHAPVLARLTHLDLAMGTMTDAGADVVIANAARFAHLEWLCVNDNALSAAAAASLCRALPQTEIGAQKERRYVSVAE